MHYEIDMLTHGTASVEPVGSTGWSKSVIFNMVIANGTELVQTINLLTTDHANTYAIVFSHFLAPQVLANVTTVSKTTP